MFDYSGDPEVREILKRAHKERAEFTAALFKRFFRALVPGRLRTVDA